MLLIGCCMLHATCCMLHLCVARCRYGACRSSALARLRAELRADERFVSALHSLDCAYLHTRSSTRLSTRSSTRFSSHPFPPVTSCAPALPSSATHDSMCTAGQAMPFRVRLAVTTATDGSGWPLQPLPVEPWPSRRARKRRETVACVAAALFRPGVPVSLSQAVEEQIFAACGEPTADGHAVMCAAPRRRVVCGSPRGASAHWAHPVPHLHRDWAHPVPHLHRDRAHPMPHLHRS